MYEPAAWVSPGQMRDIVVGRMLNFVYSFSNLYAFDTMVFMDYAYGMYIAVYDIVGDRFLLRAVIRSHAPHTT